MCSATRCAPGAGAWALCSRCSSCSSRSSARSSRRTDPTAYITTPFAKPSAIAKLGGDVLGRDVLSRVLDGGWELMLLAAAATLLGVALGAVAGIYAGYRRGTPDAIVMRAVDVLLAFPQIVFVLLLVSRGRAERVAARGRGRALARAPGGARAPRLDARHLRARLRQGRGDHRGLEPAGDERRDLAEPHHAADGRARSAA